MSVWRTCWQQRRSALDFLSQLLRGKSVSLACQHRRWELNDLARRLDKQPAAVELCAESVPAPASNDTGLTPEGRRMLEAIGSLPEGEREAFDLVRIQGLTQAEAAVVLGVSAMTVNRRLTRGLQLLAEALADLRPDENVPRSDRAPPVEARRAVGQDTCSAGRPEF